MMYDIYENKIRKIANIKKFIIKYKIIISIIIVFIMALIVSYLSTMGIITSEISCPEEVVYGDSYSYKAKALFSNVKYQFSIDGKNEWSTSAPKTPGKYKIRAVSNKSFGKKGYSDIKVFSILPKNTDIYVATSNYEYGSEPSLAINLSFNDKIKNVEILYNDITAKKTTASINLSSIVIVNDIGEDVTNCYNLTSVTKDIEFSPRSITIRPMNKDKIYDGKPINFESNDCEYVSTQKISESDTIQVATNITDNNGNEVAALNAGNYKASFDSSSISIFNGNNNVSNNYNIKYNATNFTIHKRLITIETLSASKVYDGKQLTAGFNIINDSNDEGLVSGHRVQIKNQVSITNASTTDNVIEIDIFDENNIDVTKNYQIEYNYGSLEIQKKDISINPFETKDYIYNGQYYNYPDKLENFNLDTSLIDNDSIEKISVNYIDSNNNIIYNPINVGKYKIIIENVIFYTGLKDNYNYISNDILLTILPKEITVETDSASKIYDKQPLSAEYNVDDLIPSHRSQTVSPPQIIDVGTLENKFTVIILDNNYDDITYNYKINYKYGLLEITKREITIELLNQEKIYDGTNEYEDIKYSIISDLNILSGDEINKLDVEYHLNDHVVEPIYVGTYDMFITYAEINNNYIVNISNANRTFEITKRTLEFFGLSGNKIYDGQELKGEYEYSNIAIGDNIKITSLTSILNAGSVDNNIYFLILDKNERDVTYNYDIIADFGTLTIFQREVEIKAIDFEKIYDGTTNNEYPENNHIVTSNLDFLNGDSLTISKVQYYQNGNITFPKNVGTYEIYITEASASDNYKLIYSSDSGTYNIRQRDITIETPDLTVTYNGQAHSSDIITIKDSNSLITNHSWRIVDNTSRVDVCKDRNEMAIEIYEDFNDVTYNYNISYEYGYLEIVKRNITISNINKESVCYDNYSHNYSENDYKVVSDLGIVGDDKLNITSFNYFMVNQDNFVSELILASKYNVYINTYEFEDATDNNNYSITCLKDEGNFEIVQRDIVIGYSDYTKIYDAKPISNADLYIYYDTINGYDLANFDIEIFTDITNIENVGIYENMQIFSLKIIDINENDKTNNYNISYVNRRLEITHRIITISPIDQTKIFDNTTNNVYNEEDYIITSHFGLLPNDIVEIKDVEYRQNAQLIKPMNIGIYEIYIKKATLSNNNYLISEDSYNISAQYEIVPKRIEIMACDISKPYDGYAAIYPEGLYKLSDGPSYFELDIDVEYRQNGIVIENPKDAGIYDIYIIRHSNYPNYDITISSIPGVLTIEKVTVNITTSNKTEIYNGIYLYSDTFTADLNLADYEYIISSYSFIRDVGKVKNEIVIEVYSNGLNVSNNFNIRYVYGTLEVLKREIEIQTIDNTAIYGEKIKGDYQVISENGIIYGDELQIDRVNIYSGNSLIDGPIYVGTYNYIINSASFIDEVTNSNYSIKFNNSLATLNIIKRDITLQSYDRSKVYDGKYFRLSSDLKDNIFIVNESNIGEGLSTEYNDKIFHSSAVEYINAGTMENAFSVRIINGANDVINNYNITYIYGTVTIYPREVTISLVDQEKIYDNKVFSYPKEVYEVVSEYDILEGDTLEIKDFSYKRDGKIANPIDAGKYTMHIDDFIFSNYNYNIFISNTPSYLTIHQRVVEIETFSASKVYDGSPLIGDFIISPTNEETGILNFHTYQVIYQASITNVGTITNKIEINVLDSDQNDVTSNYICSFINGYGILTIHPREIVVEALNQTKVYDGTDVYIYPKDDYKVTSNFKVYEGDILEVQSVAYYRNGLLVNPINAGDYEIYVYTISINGITYDLSTDNYIDNYYVRTSSEPGFLTIQKKKISFVTLDKEKIYDKTELVGEYSILGLADTDKIEIISLTSIINVGSIPNRIEYKTINTYSNMEFDLFNNYEGYVYRGTLTIKPRLITIEANEQSKIYDGTEDYNLSSTSYVVTSELDIIKDDNLEILQISFSDKPINVGYYDILIKKAEFSDYLTNNNYIIRYSKNTALFEVLKREIKIQAKDQEKLYDGTNFDYPTLDFDIVSPLGTISHIDELYNDSLKVRTVKYFKDGFEKDPLNAGVYDVYIEEASYDNQFINDNYLIKYSDIPATLTIFRIEVTIEAVDQTKVYDGTSDYDYPQNAYKVISNNNNVNTDSIIVLDVEYRQNDEKVTAVNVGNYDIIITNATVLSSSDDNFIVKFSEKAANYEITKKLIEIETLSNEKIYDGEQLIAGYIVNKGLIDNHFVSIYNQNSLTNVGVIDNYIDFNIYDANNELVTYNYEFKYILGELKVDYREITIEAKDQTFIYNGEIFNNQNDSYTIVSELGLLKGDFANISSCIYKKDGLEILPVNVDKYEIYIVSADINNSNYKIEYSVNPGTLKITPRNVTISATNQTKVYDGTSNYIYPELSYAITSEQKIIEKDNLRVEVSYLLDGNDVDPINVGEYEIIISSITFDNNINNLNYNINFSSNFATFTIRKRKVELLPKKLEDKVFDGIEYNLIDGFDITSGSFINDDESELSYSIGVYVKETLTAKILNANIYTIKFNYCEFNDIDIANNYNLILHSYDLTISAVDLLIDLITPDDIIYNGLIYELYPDGKNYNLLSGNLLDGEELVLNTKIYNSKNVEVKDVYLADIYTIKYESAELINGEIQNYKIKHPKSVTFEIKKLSLKIYTGTYTTTYNGEEVSYLEDYGISEDSLDKLLENHKLFISQTVIEGSNRPYTVEVNAGIYTNKINFAIINITGDSSNNIDETANYELDYDYGIITILPRKITIKTGDYTQVYQGQAKPLSCGDYTILSNNENEGLLSTDIITSINLTQVYNVKEGEVENRFIIKITNSNGDVSDNYNIEYIYGTLKLLKRNLTIEVIDCIVEYNAEAVDLNKVSVLSNGVATKDVLSIDFDKINQNELLVDGIINVGTYIIQIRKINMEYYSKDIIDNYLIDIIDSEATVEITKHDIYVDTFDKIFSFTNIKNYYLNFESTPLFLDHKLLINSNDEQPYIQYPGTVDNKLTFILVDGQSNDISDNYNLIYDTIGVLTIENKIYILSDMAYEYNGNWQTYSLTRSSAFSPDGVEMSDIIIDLETKEFTLKEVDVKIEVEVINYNIRYTGKAILSAEEREIFSKSFEILGINLTAKMCKRRISARPSDLEKTYDGLGLYSDLGDYTLLSGTLVENHKLEITATYNISNQLYKAVKFSKNMITSYRIISEITQEDVTKNYEVICSYVRSDNDTNHEFNSKSKEFYGIINIIRRNLHVSTGSASKIYDGTALYCNDYSLENEENMQEGIGLLNNHKFDVVLNKYSITNVGGRNNKVVYKIYDEENNNVTNNYKIIWDCGYLEIYPKKITITTESAEKPFDGTPLTCNDFTVNGLPDGCSVSVEDLKFTSSITYEGTIKNTIDPSSIIIYNKLGQKVTKNFEIEIIFGELIVTPNYGN